MQKKFIQFIRKFSPFNRRQHPRFETNRSIKIVCIYAQSGQKLDYSAEIVNISKAGILIMTNENKIYPKTEVEFRFQLPSRKEPISIHGRVLRTYRRHMQNCYYSGVEFKNKEEEGVGLLLDFVLKPTNSLKKITVPIFIFSIVISNSFLIGAGIAASQYTGERIVYAISPVGIAEYKDLGMVEFLGKRAHLATFRTKVFKFDDTEKIYTDPNTYLPLRVERDISIWPIKENIVEEYDQRKFIFTLKKFKKNKEIEKRIFKEDGPIHNAILLPFSLRNIDELYIGWSLDVRLPDKFKVSLVSIEDIEVPAGKFKAYHFISIPNKFEIWISKDKFRIPLKIKGMGGLSYTFSMKEHILKE